MDRLRGLAARLRSLLRRGAAERDLDEEIRFHLEMEAEKYRARGMGPAEARRRAVLAFGGVEKHREAMRDGRRIGWLEDAWLDARFAARALRRSPGFTLVAALTLGLGIGATAAAFSAVDGILLRPLPYPEPDRLVRIFQQNSPTNRWGLSVVDFRAIEERQRSLESLAAVSAGEAALSGGEGAEWVRVGRATEGLFRTLGVSMARGRGFQPSDARPGAPPVVVIGHSFGERHFGAGAEVLGRSVTLDRVDHAVVGVLPPGVEELAGTRAALWPILRPETPERRGPFLLRVIGRLRPGTTVEAAARDLASVSERIFPLWEASFQDRTARLTPYPLRETLIGDAADSLRIFSAAVALVLLIGVANVANLVLVRAAGRQREIAVRASLGAARGRLARLLLTESLLLGLLGCLVGLVVALAGIRALALFNPDLPRLDQVALDPRTVGFAAGVALLSSVLAGAYPLVFGLSRNLGASLRGGFARGSGGRGTRRFQGALVVAEFTLALPLLLAAGLLLHSLVRLQRVDPGFPPENLLTMRVSLPETTYPDPEAVLRFWDDALRGVREVPGVAEAGLTQLLPPDVYGDNNNFDLVDRPVEPGGAQPVAPWAFVTPGYFRTLRLPLVEGRVFSPGDDGDAPNVLVVSRAWAERYYPGESAVGRRVRSGGCTECEPATVVGVVGDVKFQGLQGSGEAVYEPFLQAGLRTVHLVARTEVAPASVVAAVRGRIRAVDPDLPLDEVSTLEERLHASVAGPRHWSVLLGGYAAAALLLAATGVFGVMSYMVRQRKQEIGVRIALGAAPASVVALVLRRGLLQVLAGLVLGLIVFSQGVRVLEGILFDVGPADPLTLGAASLLLLAVALLACWIPGRRAARIDPMEAIAAE